MTITVTFSYSFYSWKIPILITSPIFLRPPFPFFAFSPIVPFAKLFSSTQLLKIKAQAKKPSAKNHRPLPIEPTN